jgi:small GTP-binding protein
MDSAEMKDIVPSLVREEPFGKKNSGDFRKKSKSAVLGGGGSNRLRVRSSSNAYSNNNLNISSYLAPRASAKTVDNLEEEFDYFYKIIVIGDEVTGKTNFLLRIVNGIYNPKPKTTYGVEFLFKTVPLPNSNQKVKAQIWDTSGAREFLSITTTHYRFAVGAFLVYDVSNIQSFLNLKDWLNKIREFSDPNVVIALVANKSDLVDEDDKLKCYGKYEYLKKQKFGNHQNMPVHQRQYST